MNKIIQIVADFYGIDENLIFTRTKVREIRHPRQVAQYFIYKKTRLPYIAIGKRFGRDHSTIVNSVKKIDFAYKHYKSDRQELKEIERRIDNENYQFDDENVMENLLTIFLVEKTDDLSKTDITENDIKMLGDRLGIDIKQLTEITETVREYRKRRLQESIQKKEDLLRKQHEDEFNESKEEQIKKPTDEQDTFGI